METDGSILRSGEAKVSVSVVDGSKRDFIRGFGQLLGSFGYGGHTYEIISWGHVSEIRRKGSDNSIFAEINIQSAMKLAVDLLQEECPQRAPAAA